MKAYERRLEIMRILGARRHTTIRELAEEFFTCEATIREDIQNLSIRYPIYTKQGAYGGVFVMDTYRPYNDSLTLSEIDMLIKLYEKAKGKDRETLSQIIRKYGPDKLEL